MQYRTIIIALTLMAFSAVSSAQTSSDTLQAELLEMGRLDQQVRERIMDLVSGSGPEALSSDEFRALADEQQQVDETNFLRLEEIIREHGWPSAELVGERANGVAWLIMQHASIERQQRYLPLLRQAVSETQARASMLALLEDEIALAEEGEQIYGTEITLRDGKALLAPIANPGEIDERRAAVGLPPIDEYLRQAEAELGMPVDRRALARQPDH